MIKNINWYYEYKISQSGTVLYRGTPKLETKLRARDFRGVYFSLQPMKGYGPFIGQYKLLTNKMFSPTPIGYDYRNPKTDYLVEEFYEKYGYTVDKKQEKWQDMGSPRTSIPAKDSKVDYVSKLSYLLLFPTQEWVNFLKSKGYDGFIVKEEGHVFVFDPKNVQYIGQYNKNI